MIRETNNMSDYVEVKLDKEQIAELEAEIVKVLPKAIASTNDDTVRQGVLTAFGINWLITWWRDIDDLIADKWHCRYYPIHQYVIDTVDIDDVCCTNMIACKIKDGDVIRQLFVDEDEEEDEE